MEKNIVVIDLEKYEKLIKDFELSKVRIKELEELCNLLESQNSAIDSNITDRIYKKHDWELGHLVEEGKDNNEYYINKIISSYNEYGYTSIDYINSCVDKMIERYKEQKDSEENDNN